MATDTFPIDLKALKPLKLDPGKKPKLIMITGTDGPGFVVRC